MVKDSSYMFVTGPDVVKTVTNEVVSAEELGGASTHTRKSAVADGAFENDVEALSEVRRLIDFLPLSNREKPPVRPFFDDPSRLEPSLDTLIPENPNQPYDMKELIHKLADEGDFFEIQAEYAKNILIGFIRLEGSTVGVVANQPFDFSNPGSAFFVALMQCVGGMFAEIACIVYLSSIDKAIDVIIKISQINRH